MAKSRQQRITEPGQIQNKLSASSGKTVQIVLRDNSVATGIVKRVSAQGVTIVNMRRREMAFDFTAITEIYLDTLD